MAATLSQYGKTVQIQNNSGSAAASAAPVGGVNLFASGSAGSAKLYVNVEGSQVDKEVGADLKIAGDSGTGTVSLGAGQTLTIAGGTGLDTSASNQTVTFSVDLGELPEEALAVADDYIVFLDGGATGASKKEKLADVVGAIAGTVTSTGLSDSNGVLSVDINNLTGITSGTPADGDLLAVYDADVGAIRKITRAELIEGAALDNINIDGGAIDGTPIGANSANAGTFTTLVAGGNVDLGDATSDTITATGRFDSDLVPSTDSARALGSSALQWSAVHVDVGHIDQLGSALDANSQAITNINVDSGNIDGAYLGTSSAIVQLTASHALITNLDVVTLNSINQTEETLEITDKLIVASLSASSANSSGGGLKIGGGQEVSGHASLLWDHGNSALDFNIGGTTEMRLADGALRPETDSDVDLGASGAAFKKLYVDDIDLNGQGSISVGGSGRIDLDADDDTSIRSSADDQIDFEVGGSDLVAIKSTGLHIVDDKKLVFGSNDDASFEYDEDGNDVLLYAGASMRFSDDVKLQFGTGGDASIEYDEDGTDELRFAGAAVTFEQAVSFDANLTLGNAASDIVTVTGRLTASRGLQIADDMKLRFGANDDASFEYDENGNDVLLYSGANMRFGDDIKLEFGAGGDATIEYDENGTDELRFAGAAVTFEQAVSFDGNLTLGNAATDVTTAASQVTASSGLLVSGNPLYVASNIITDAGAAAIVFDGSGNTSLQGNLTAGNGYSNGGYSFSTAGALSAAGDMIVGRSGNNNGADFTAHGDATGEKVFYSAEHNILQVTSSATALQVSIGGDATTEYAVDVVNGSNNNNKIRAAAFVTYSDESLKQDVASMSNTALDTVMSLEGVEFTWKDSGERDFGFIAQDVQSVLPKAVHVAENGVQGVDYSRLTSVLVEAVKAQQVQIQDLKETLAKLKK